jgi:hypothetical protein
MTISEIITLRTGLTDAETIASYVDLAEAKIRAYLNYEPSDSIERFSYTVADVAIALYDEDQAMAAAASNPALSAESFSEGGVNTSYTYKGQGNIQAEYESSVAKLLDSLKPYVKRFVTFI